MVWIGSAAEDIGGAVAVATAAAEVVRLELCAVDFSSARWF